MPTMSENLTKEGTAIHPRCLAQDERPQLIIPQTRGRNCKERLAAQSEDNRAFAW